MFELNADMHIQITKIGKENTSIIQVDDFFADYELAVQEAINSRYSSRKEDVGAFYPGLRAPLRKDYGLRILQFAARAMHQCLELPANMQVLPINANYSLLSTRPENMRLEQCIPHYDTSETHSFAILHYMNEGDFGGTAFYRHCPTGFENIHTAREDQYLKAMQKHFDQNGPPKRAYFSDSDSHYELIHKVDYQRNRLVIYPTSILHSAYIDKPERDVNENPRTGRLSSNFLFKFQLKSV